MDLKEKRERLRSEVSLPVFLACRTSFSQGILANVRDWESGISWVKKYYRRSSSWSVELGVREEGTTTVGVLLKTWDEPGDGTWGNGGKREGIQLTNLLPWPEWFAGPEIMTFLTLKKCHGNY